MRNSCCVFGALLLSAVLLAPVSAQNASDIELTRAQIQKERQAIVAAEMKLTEDEGLAFWPAYRDYRLDMARVGDRAVKVITEFVSAKATLTDEQATRLLDEYLACQADRVAVRKKHVKRMRQLLPPVKVTRFFQLENKLDAVVDFELAATVPLTR